MSFPILILLLVALVPSALWTSSTMNLVWEREREQIYADNGAIVAGRAYRELMNTLVRENRKIAQIESAHHVFHTCAKAGVVKCLAPDQAAEAAARAWAFLSRAKTEVMWRKVEAEIEGAVAASGYQYRIERSPFLPFEIKRCGVCDGYQGWNLAQADAKTRTRILVGEETSLVHAFEKGGQLYGYRLGE